MAEETRNDQDNLNAKPMNEAIGEEKTDTSDAIQGTADLKNQVPDRTPDLNRSKNSEPSYREKVVSVSATPSGEPKSEIFNAEALTPLGGNVMSIKKIQTIKVNVQVMLGSVSMSISRLASLKKGELISLDTNIGDPIEILANGQLIARGEIVVLGEENPKFGISLVEIVDSDITAT